MLIRQRVMSAACALSLSAWCLAAAADEPYRDPTGDARYVRIAPPTLPTEPSPTGLTDQQQWIPGHWAWNTGSFSWRAGQVVAKPADAVSWQPGRWEHVTTRHRGWRWLQGTWITADRAPGTGRNEKTLLQ
jgi:hypothetical protein